MKLTFTLRRAFGHERYYPSGPESGAIVALTGRACLKEVELRRLKFVGFEIVICEESGPQAKERVL